MGVRISAILSSLAVLVLGAGAGAAAADPAPAPAPVDPFVANSAQTQNNPVAALADLLVGGPVDSPTAMISQSLGSVGFREPPPADPLVSALSLAAQNYRMPSTEEASPYVLQTQVQPGPFARVDGLKGTHALIHGGLGRMPGAELGQPLPGTAAPPDANLPAGLEQFYLEPEPPTNPATNLPQ